MLSVERVRPAYVQVAAQLQELIVRGDLTAGQRLPVEAELSTMFGVSRSTVREALRLLSSQHLVETRRGVHGGTFVAAPDTGLMGDFLETGLGLLSGADLVSVDQLIEACDLLEVPAARLAAVRRTPTQLEMIRKAATATERIEDPVERYEGSNGFHASILAACGNPLLNLVATPVFSVLRTRFQRSSVDATFWDRSARQHHEIYEAIERGDAEQAGILMRSHIDELRVLVPGGVEAVRRRTVGTGSVEAASAIAAATESPAAAGSATV